MRQATGMGPESVCRAAKIEARFERSKTSRALLDAVR